MRFAAIDLGASFIKSALLDTGSFTVSHVERLPSPSFPKNLPAGFREIPAEDLLRIAKGQIDRLLSIAPDCAGIVSCGQMHGLVLTDGQGAPLTDFISWMDERARPTLETLVSKLKNGHGEDWAHEITAGSTVAILFWLATTRGIPKDAIPCSLSDFVMSRLSQSETQCEPTMASGFGVFDVLNGRWHFDALEELGLGHLRWPQIARATERIGSYRWGTNRIPVYASLGDQQCALLGSLLKPGELSVNVSTGSQVSTVKNHFERGDYEVRAYFDGMFLNTVTHLPAGRTLNEQVALSKIPWDRIEEDPLFRAAFEKMAEAYHTAALKLDPSAAWERLVFSGGLIAKSTLLQQLVQKRFGLAVRVSPAQEDTLLGLLRLSMTLSGQSATVLQAAV